MWNLNEQYKQKNNFTDLHHLTLPVACTSILFRIFQNPEMEELIFYFGVGKHSDHGQSILRKGIENIFKENFHINLNLSRVAHVKISQHDGQKIRTQLEKMHPDFLHYSCFTSSLQPNYY